MKAKDSRIHFESALLASLENNQRRFKCSPGNEIAFYVARARAYTTALHLPESQLPLLVCLANRFPGSRVLSDAFAGLRPSVATVPQPGDAS